MTTRVAHHRIVSATLQHTHYNNFTTLNLVAMDEAGNTLEVELFTDGDALMPTWLPPFFQTKQFAEAACP